MIRAEATTGAKSAKKTAQVKFITGASLGGIIILSLYSLITVVPLGSRPHPLNLYKFRRACQGDFWLQYDPLHLKRVKSNRMIILSRYGLLFFDAEPGTYRADEVLAYGEKNGWKCHGKAAVTRSQLMQYGSGACDRSEDNFDCIMRQYLGTESASSWQEKDCTIFAFETGNVHGLTSYISIAADGSQMEIRHIDHSLPDPAMPFVLPHGFGPLNVN